MSVSTGESTLTDRLAALTLHDEQRLGRRLAGARRIRTPHARAAVQAEIERDVADAEQRVARRRAAVPPVTYPALPVSARRADIAAAIRDHQVVVVAGETGSGKTTQLPKICLELGRGVRGMIGHTQPRRIAARSVAERVASELGTPVGEAVGWKVRFTDHVSDRTLVKVMTDGILLAELAADRELRQYDTIIVDEAHERSLNIDFLLGYLARLLPRRPDLKVVITSATIDQERFAAHFGAPVVEVSGRTYPVEVRYRPVVDPDDPDADPDRDVLTAVADAVTELSREGPGDVLAFFPGEREIRQAADALAGLRLRDTEILPLYGRLSAAEQHRVFTDHPGRRIVLATNVAETSLTVPGIRYVVDTGTARISRYSRRLKVQRLPIEKISQASAAQRAGRCGRVADGICIRLYAEDDFDARPEYTEPEILRTNLASVVLQMTALDLGEVADFPFVDPPDARAVADGVGLLTELGALEGSRLTPVGRELARLPVDPRLGRMLIQANENGCLREVLVIAAALSVQDPRERPVEQRAAADASHARFAGAGSDFLAYVALWDYLEERRQALSGSRFRKLCQQEFLHYLRVREWRDLHQQLRSAVRSGLTENDTAAEPARVHQALLAGLLSQVGVREGETRRAGAGGGAAAGVGLSQYQGARGARFAVFPGSALAGRPPRWVMAGELVETSRLWARTVASIQPEWIEPLAGHLVKRALSEPRWSGKRGAAVATERVTLYGVPVVVGRTVDLAGSDPELARDLFLRHALVEGDWAGRHRFLQENRALLADVEELEERARRRDLVVDPEALVAFYDDRVPAEVTSGRRFDAWWKKARRERPDLLDFTPEMLRTDRADEVDRTHYPDHVDAGLRVPLSYAFEPGTAADGVSVDVPVAALHQLDPTPFTWQVPGLREELVTALIKTLPKSLRRLFAPAPDHARAVLARVRAGEEPLLDALERELGRLRGVAIPRESWDLDRLPEHLAVTFRAVDENGSELGSGTDLAELRRRLAPAVRAELSAVGADLERTGWTAWDPAVPELPREHRAQRGGHVVVGYPALVDRGDAVDVRVLPTADEQRVAMWRGTRRLLLLGTPSPERPVQRGLDNRAKLTLARNPHGSVPALVADCVTAAADALIAVGGGPAWDAAGYARLAERFRTGLATRTVAVLAAVRDVLGVWHRLAATLDGLTAPVLAAGVADVREQLADLTGPGFVTSAGADRLADVRRYLEAAERRIEKLCADPARDAAWTAQVDTVRDAYDARLAAVPPGAPVPPELAEVRWMIEELRVGLYAHPMRTRYPVSVQRLLRRLGSA